MHTRIWYKYIENHSVKHESLHKRYNAVKLAHKQLFSEQPSSCKKTFDHTGRSNSSHLWCSHSIVEGGPIKSDVRITWKTNILICSWTRALLLKCRIFYGAPAETEMINDTITRKPTYSQFCGTNQKKFNIAQSKVCVISLEGCVIIVYYSIWNNSTIKKNIFLAFHSFLFSNFQLEYSNVISTHLTCSLASSN